MKKKFITSFIIMSVLLFSITFSYSYVIDRIVARVNDDIIKLSDLDNFYKSVASQSGNGVTNKIALNELIKITILFQLAEDLNVDISDKEVQDEIKKLKFKSAKSSLNQYQKFDPDNIYLMKLIIKKNKTVGKLFQYIRMNNLIEEPSEEEIRKEYENNSDAFHEKERIQISHIVLLTPNDISYPELTAKEELANKIIKWIKSGKDDFATLAKQYSEDKNKEAKMRGGKIKGWFTKSLLKQVKFYSYYTEVAFSLKKGEVSDIIKSPIGFHIIKVLDKKPASKRTFTQAKKYILSQFLMKRSRKQLGNMIEMKRKRSRIENLL
jgi:parvulin-like peptidyl-prolyl isomerase